MRGLRPSWRLAGAFASLIAGGAVCVFAAAGPHAAVAGTHPESTRATKVRLLTGFADAFDGPPQFVILGSSRAMRAQPAFVTQRLHLRGFNAAIGSGTAADALAYVRLVKRLYPGQPFGVLWLLDVETLRLSGLSDYVRSVPDLLACLPEGVRRSCVAAGSDPADADLGYGLPSASAQAVSKASTRSAYPDLHSRWARDGYLVWSSYDYDRLRGVTTGGRLGIQLAQYRGIYPSRVRDGMTGWSKWCVREVLREAAAMGVTPVVVLTPYHPTLRRFIVARGWGRIHAAVLAFLRDQQAETPLRVLDMTSISSFGGWPNGFYDGVHPRPAMTRRLLAAVLRRAGTALEPPLSEPPPTPTPTPAQTPPPNATPAAIGTPSPGAAASSSQPR